MMRRRSVVDTIDNQGWLSKASIGIFRCEDVDEEEARKTAAASWACIFVLITMAIQNVAVVQNADGSGIKPYHIVLLVMLLWTFAKRGLSWRLPPTVFTFIIIILGIVSLIDSAVFGFTSVMFNYLVMLLIIATLMNLGAELKPLQWEQVARIGSAIIMSIVLLNLVSQRDVIFAFIANPGYHPELTPVLGGGVNLEATWLALFGVFYERNWKGVAYLGLCAVISGFYLSRVGIVLCMIAALYVYLKRPRGKSIPFRILILTLAVLAIGVALSDTSSLVISRFSTIGDDNGTRGRMLIWQHIEAAFLESPIFGHGAGNAMSSVSNIAGREFLENNVHNYYAQVLIDFGAVGFALFLCLIVRFALNVKRDGLTPCNMALLLYLAAAMIQFRGGESMLGFFLAAYFCCASAYRANEILHKPQDKQKGVASLISCYLGRAL